MTPGSGSWTSRGCPRRSWPFILLNRRDFSPLKLTLSAWIARMWFFKPSENKMILTCFSWPRIGPRRPWPFNFTELAWFQCFNTEVFIFLLFVYVSLISGMIDRKITQLIFIIKKFVKMNDSNFCMIFRDKKSSKKDLQGLFSSFFNYFRLDPM